MQVASSLTALMHQSTSRDMLQRHMTTQEHCEHFAMLKEHLTTSTRSPCSRSGTPPVCRYHCAHMEGLGAGASAIKLERPVVQCLLLCKPQSTSVLNNGTASHDIACRIAAHADDNKCLLGLDERQHQVKSNDPRCCPYCWLMQGIDRKLTSGDRRKMGN